MSRKKNEKIIRLVSIQVKTKKDKLMWEKIVSFLDKHGYTIAKKTDLILHRDVS